MSQESTNAATIRELYAQLMAPGRMEDRASIEEVPRFFADDIELLQMRGILGTGGRFLDWVEKYVPAQIGEGKYFPHLTVGVAKFDDLKVIEAEPFDPSTVHAAGVAVYHLGNNGTARALLKEWPLTDS